MYNYLCELGGVCYNVLYNVVYEHCTREYVGKVISSYRWGFSTEKSYKFVGAWTFVVSWTIKWNDYFR